MKRKHILWWIAGLVLIIVLTLLVISCQAAPGPQGPAGPPGSAGPAGPTGKVISGYAGSKVCAACHEDISALVNNSGHAYKLNKVEDGKPPVYPFTEVSNPPEGYTWDDVTYVIGGYNWKARFIDKEGYIITGADENATTQYNFANPIVGTDAGWSGYHAGEEQKPYNCGSCHTTGYRPEGNQDGLPGLIGTWSEPGIQCESCHGPSSAHAGDPYNVTPLIDRDSESCGTCHVRGTSESIDASGGFIRHHEQYEELLQTKHISLDCVTCHDPHKGVVQGRKTDGDTTRVDCQSCHFKQETNQKSAVMQSVVDCIDCHMPRIVKSAVGNADGFTGDIRAHLFAINPEATAQFSEDGKTVISQVSLDFACKSCHRDGGTATVKTDEQLKSTAIDYHERP